MPSTPFVHPALIARVETFHARFHAARMGALAALPGNPFGVEVCPLSVGTACKVRHPLLAGKNRVLGFTPCDLDQLDDLVDFYRADGPRFSLSVLHGRTTPELFRRLVEAGLWTAGSGTVPALSLETRVPAAASPGIHVRRSEPAEREAYLDLFQRAFGHRGEERAAEYRLFQWAEDSLPGGARYVAEIRGEPVGMASLTVLDAVGLCATAGVLLEFRGRGVQAALIRRRVADAAALGCDLLLGGGSPGTTTFRNFERAGFRLLPTGPSWGELPR